MAGVFVITHQARQRRYHYHGANMPRHVVRSNPLDLSGLDPKRDYLSEMLEGEPQCPPEEIEAFDKAIKAALAEPERRAPPDPILDPLPLSAVSGVQAMRLLRRLKKGGFLYGR